MERIFVDNEVIGLFIKKFDTKNQAGLNFEERSKNLSGSFAVTDKKLVKNKKILLVDDVLTTGATANEIARILAKAGAEETCVITVCSTEGK